MVTEESGLALSDPGLDRGVAPAVALQKQGGGTGAFIHPEVGTIVLLLAQRESGFGKRLLKTFQVRGFVVGNDAVEIENDGAQSSLLRAEPVVRCATLTERQA